MQTLIKNKTHTTSLAVLNACSANVQKFYWFQFMSRFLGSRLSSAEHLKKRSTLLAFMTLWGALCTSCLTSRDSLWIIEKQLLNNPKPGRRSLGWIIRLIYVCAVAHQPWASTKLLVFWEFFFCCLFVISTFKIRIKSRRAWLLGGWYNIWPLDWGLQKQFFSWQECA